MTAQDELTAVVSSVTDVLTRRGVPYFVTGSLAASAHAEFRATNDIDIVADFDGVDLRVLVSDFDAEFHADPEQALACVRDGQSFNLIHKATFLKVDFFSAVSDFNHIAIERAELLSLGEGGSAIRVATREDILLSKLSWYRLGGETSERQQRDIESIIAFNRETLDRPYLTRWASVLEVGDLLDRFIEFPA